MNNLELKGKTNVALAVMITLMHLRVGKRPSACPAKRRARRAAGVRLPCQGAGQKNRGRSLDQPASGPDEPPALICPADQRQNIHVLTLLDYLKPSIRRAPKRNGIKRREKDEGEQDTKKSRQVLQDAAVNVDATCLGKTKLRVRSRMARKSRGLRATPVGANGNGVC